MGAYRVYKLLTCTPPVSCLRWPSSLLVLVLCDDGRLKVRIDSRWGQVDSNVRHEMEQHTVDATCSTRDDVRILCITAGREYAIWMDVGDTDSINVQRLYGVNSMVLHTRGHRLSDAKQERILQPG